VFDHVDLATELTTHVDIRQDGVLGPEIGDFTGVITDWWSEVANPLAQKATHTSDIRLTKIKYQKISPLEPIVTEFTTGLPIAGTAAGSTAPPQTAVLLSLRTSKVGRSFRGRVFLPPTTDEFTDDPGMLTAIRAGQIADQWKNQIVDAINALAIDVTAVVYSKVLDEPTAIQQVRCDRQIRSQRRRAPRAPSYVISTA
jgi:hypothetical protein